MKIEGQIRLERVCSLNNVFGCPVLERGKCNHGPLIGTTKLITKTIIIDGDDDTWYRNFKPAALLRNAVDMLESDQRARINENAEEWGTCQNQEDYENLMGHKPSPTLYWSNPSARTIKIDGETLMVR